MDNIWMKVRSAGHSNKANDGVHTWAEILNTYLFYLAHHFWCSAAELLPFPYSSHRANKLPFIDNKPRKPDLAASSSVPNLQPHDFGLAT